MLDLFSWIMIDFFENEPVMDFFTANFKKTIEHLYQYYLSWKTDSSDIYRIFFSVSEKVSDFNRKVLTVFSWLSVHFDSKTDRSMLFQKVDSSLEGNANWIVQNAPSSLPSVQISGNILTLILDWGLCTFACKERRIETKVLLAFTVICLVENRPKNTFLSENTLQQVSKPAFPTKHFQACISSTFLSQRF